MVGGKRLPAVVVLGEVNHTIWRSFSDRKRIFKIITIKERGFVHLNFGI